MACRRSELLAPVFLRMAASFLCLAPGCAGDPQPEPQPVVLAPADRVAALPQQPGAEGLAQHLGDACTILRDGLVPGRALLTAWRPSDQDWRALLPTLDAARMSAAYDRKAPAIAEGLERALTYRPGLRPLVRSLATDGGPARPAQWLPLTTDAAFATAWQDADVEVVAEADELWVHVGGRWRLLLGASAAVLSLPPEPGRVRTGEARAPR